MAPENGSGPHRDGNRDEGLHDHLIPQEVCSVHAIAPTPDTAAQPTKTTYVRSSGHVHATALTGTSLISTATAAFVAGWLDRYTGATRDLYDRHAGEWLIWCTAHGLDILTPDGPASVTRLHVEAYTRQLVDAGLASGTVDTMLRPVVALSRLAHADGLARRDPAAFAWRPRPTRRTDLPWLDRLELAAWLKVAATLPARHHAAGTLAGYLGIRASELAALRVESVSYADGHRVLAFTGKGAKPAVMPMPVPVMRAVDRVIDQRETGWLIPAADGLSQLSRSGIAGLFATISRRAGTPGIGPHAARRSCLTAALSAGVPMRQVQALARHAHASTTELYDMGNHTLDQHAAYAMTGVLAA